MLLLKAFLKSSLIMSGQLGQESPGSMNCSLATQNCSETKLVGNKREPISSNTKVHRHFQPAYLERTRQQPVLHPHPSCPAMSRLPKMNRCILTAPSHRWQNWQAQSVRLSAYWRLHFASSEIFYRCCGLNPSGPPVEPMYCTYSSCLWY